MMVIITTRRGDGNAVRDSGISNREDAQKNKVNDSNGESGASAKMVSHFDWYVRIHNTFVLVLDSSTICDHAMWIFNRTTPAPCRCYFPPTNPAT
jgi:hypothetical protein